MLQASNKAGVCNLPFNNRGPVHTHMGQIVTCSHNRLQFAYPIDPTTRNALTRDDVTRIELIASELTQTGPVQRIKINSTDNPGNFERYRRFNFAVVWKAGDTASLPGGAYRVEIRMTSEHTEDFWAGHGRLDVKRPASQSLAPIATDFTASHNYLTVTFDASSSDVLHGTANNQAYQLDEYLWDFGDGVTEISASPIIAHTYPDEGEYSVILTQTAKKDKPSDPCEQVLRGSKTHVICVELPFQ